MSSTREYVIFKLKGEYYGIDIRNVENIEKPSAITRVPYTENYIVGVINLRGDILPVVDLRRRFLIEQKDYDEETRIIIANINEFKIGMVVDSSSEVLQLNTEEIDVAPAVKHNSANMNYVKEIGKNDGRIIMLVDLKKVLGVEDSEWE